MPLLLPCTPAVWPVGIRPGGMGSMQRVQLLLLLLLLSCSSIAPDGPKYNLGLYYCCIAFDFVLSVLST